MQNVLTLETTKYEIKIDNFEGPLDLLCHLIEKNKLDIFEVKISDITDQYIDYINAMEQMNLEVTSEFLIMASTLLYLKPKTLLPKETDDEEELTEEELLQRIIEYKKYKEAKDRIMKDPEMKAKIDEFEKIRYESQVLAIQKGEGDSEKMQKLQQLYTILVENKDIKEYFDLEVKFNVMVADVNKIIAEAIKEVL